MRALAVVLCLWAGAAQAEIVLIPHDRIADFAGRIDFDARDRGPEPGEEYDRMIFGAGVSLAATLDGMARRKAHLPDAWGAGRHFEFSGNPAAPLRLGTEGSVAVARHRGFGSNALFPIGPDGAAQVSGRGEGTLAILFKTDQQAMGLSIHPDYPDPLGTRPPPGMATLHFWGRDGAFLGVQAIPLEAGVNRRAFASTGPGIAAVTVSNTDPGGIALDDILFQPETPSG